MPDLSWLPLMGAEALIIVGVVAIAIVFFKFGFPKLLEHRQRIAEIEASASKGVLSEDISEKLKNLGAGVKEIAATVAFLEEVYSEVSQTATENLFFSEGRKPFPRLRALRRLIAWERNGRIKDTGIQLILAHKEDWLNVLETKLEVKIINQIYYDNFMREVEKRIFDRGLL